MAEAPRPTPDQNPSILLATGNPAKQQALRSLLEGLPLKLVTPAELGLDSVPDEEGETHEAIARQKAQDWSRAGDT
ncbi:MAG: non-canonical purine NTP pyrophosphatase, partial [Dehalococcoidia bacterium]